VSRLQLLITLTLLCISGIGTFLLSSRHQSSTRQLKPSTETSIPLGSEPNHSTPTKSPPLIFSDDTRLPQDPTHYEITVSDLNLLELSAKIERESLERLELMTAKYRLTPNQRRKIFPLLVNYHTEFRPGLIVNGLPALTLPSDKPLSDQIYPLLDLIQQEDYQRDLLANTDWWSEVLGQFRDHLDQAIRQK